MNPSPLQLERYFFSEVASTVSREFKLEEPALLQASHLRVEHQVKVLDANLRRWECVLRIQLQAPPEANSPYAFVTECIGQFHVAQDWPADKDETLVRTNAPAVLFGMAREFVRSLMAAGPYSPILLPTVNFADAALPKSPEVNPTPIQTSVASPN